MMKMNLVVPDYLTRLECKKEEVAPEPGQSEITLVGLSGQSGPSVPKKKHKQVMFNTPPKGSKIVGSSLKAPYAPSHTPALSGAGAGRGAQMKAMGASGAKSSLLFTSPGSVQ